MNDFNADHDDPSTGLDPESEAKQKKMNVMNLFRLVETAVQTTQLKVAGRVVVPAQDVIGSIISSKSEFDDGHLEAAQQGLRQASEAYRYKVVRWEAEARGAEAGQRQLTSAQKKQLPSEVSSVRTASRKTLIFFDRLMTELVDWENSSPSSEKAAAEEPAAADEVESASPDPVADGPPGDILETDIMDGFTLMSHTETDQDGITLSFSLISSKLFKIDVADVRIAKRLEFKFKNPSDETAILQVELFNGTADPILSKPEGLQLPSTKGAVARGHIVIAAEKIDAEIDDTQAVAVEFENVADHIEISDVALRPDE